MRGTWLILTVLAISGPAARADWWYTYEASDGTFPEQQGFYRATMGAGGQRWFEDGAFVLDTSTDPGIVDFYYRSMPSLPDPNDPTHAFVCEWGLRIDSFIGWRNPEVFLAFQGYADMGLQYELDGVYSLYGGQRVADFAPGVFHAYRLVTSDMVIYTLEIDGMPVYTGELSPWAPTSFVKFGDGMDAAASASCWQYVRYGVVSALVGDANCDGTVDFGDINPFIGVLTVPAGMPGCGVMNADINQDGAVDFADINPFVDLMLQVR